MLKKIFCAAFLMAAIIFVGNAKVFAQDVWIYSGGGTDYYIVTETWQKNTSDANLNKYGRRTYFEGYVKYVRGNSLTATKKYTIVVGEGCTDYRVNDSEMKRFSYGDNESIEAQVAWKLGNYCCKKFDYNPFR